MNREALSKFANSPMSFFDSIQFRTAKGMKPFGNVMAPFQRERFTSLAPALLAVAQHRKPEIGRHWWEATKGCSKDSDLALCLLWLLAFSSRPLAIQVAAADQDQADELRKAAKMWLAWNPWLSQRLTIHNWRIICKASDCEAEIISCDIGGSHGARPDVLILNELSHIHKWEFAETLMDNASKIPNGLVVVALNAGFVGTPAFKWREMARTSPRWKFHQYAEPAPWLDPAEIDEARRRNTPSRFARLFMGVWQSGLGDALEDADITAAIDYTLGPMLNDPREPGLSFAAGLDLGIKSDHSALVVLGKRMTKSQTPMYRLASVQSWAPSLSTGKVDLESVEHAVAEAKRLYRLQSVAYDPWQAALMADRLSKQNVKMIEVPFVGKNLDAIATLLLETFRNRVFTMFDCPRLITDLRKLSIVEKSYGYRLEATRDGNGHADTATALSLALLAARDHCQAGINRWGGVVNVPRTDRGIGYFPQ